MANETDTMAVPETINSAVIVDPVDGSTIQHDGPFEFAREGGSFEVVISLGTEDYAGIPELDGKRLIGREGEILIARCDGEVEGSGIMESVSVVEEDTLAIRVDDPKWAAPEDIDVDIDELDVR